MKIFRTMNNAQKTTIAVTLIVMAIITIWAGKELIWLKGRYYSMRIKIAKLRAKYYSGILTVFFLGSGALVVISLNKKRKPIEDLRE